MHLNNTAVKYLSLSPEETRYAAGLLEIIVNPAVEHFGAEMDEALKLFGWYQEPVKRTRYQKKKGIWPTRGAGRMKPGWKPKTNQ